MKKLIMFVLVLHVLPIFVLSWISLFGVSDFSNTQWGVAWFMAWASGMVLTYPMFFFTEECDAKK